LLHEGQFHHVGLQGTVAHVYPDAGVEGGKLCQHIAQSDGFAQCRRLGTGSDAADQVSFSVPDLVVVSGDAFVEHFEPYEAFFRTIGLLPGKVFGGGEGFAEPGDPSQAGFEGGTEVVDVVPIEAVAHFESEGIACAKADGLQAFWTACLEDGVPDLVGGPFFILEIYLHTPCAGIAGSAYQDVVDTGEVASREGIVGEVEDIHFSEWLQDAGGLWPLYGEQAGLVGDVVHVDAGVVVSQDPFPVFGDVGGIDHEHVGFVLFQAVDEEVVDDAAVLVGEAAVLGLAVGQFGGVVGGDALDEVEGMGSLEDELAHVADVEDAGIVPNGVMFVVDTAVGDRHVIAGEFGHFRAEGDVFRRERGLLHGV